MRDLEVSTAVVIVRAIQIQTLGGGAWERVLGCWSRTDGCRGGMPGRRIASKHRWVVALAARLVLGQHKTAERCKPRLETPFQSKTYWHARILAQVD